MSFTKVKSTQIDVAELAGEMSTAGVLVESVNGDTGIVTITAADLGLGNVDNTSDINKPVSTATSTALGFKENTANKGVAGGYASLDGTGKIPSGQLPALAISNTFVVANQAAMLALSTAETGDVAVRQDGAGSFILAGTNYSVLADWQLLNAPTDAVVSVNGYTGTVSLTAADVSAAPSTHVGSNGASHAVADGTFDGFMSSSNFTKLAGIAIGATANSSDAYLLSRTNHTGTQASTTISDFSEAVDDRVFNLLTEGSNIDYVYNDAGNTFSIAVNPNPIWTGTSHERMVTGTTAERPVSPINGDTRFNSTLSREEIYKGAWTPFGKVLQVVTGDVAVTTITSATPAFDNSAPLISEGTSIWSTSFTPLKSTSKILVMFNVWHANSNNARAHTGAVFYGATLLSSFAGGVENSARPSNLTYIKQHLPGNTTTVTIDARMGTPGGNTLYVNQGATQTLGGTGTTTYIILEIEA